MKSIRHIVPKKLEAILTKMGPVRCALTGAFFYLSEKAFAAKAAYEFKEGHEFGGVFYGGAACFSLIATATFFIVGDGYMPIRNYYKQKKKERRARRLYNSWKNCPSYRSHD